MAAGCHLLRAKLHHLVLLLEERQHIFHLSELLNEEKYLAHTFGNTQKYSHGKPHTTL